MRIISHVSFIFSSLVSFFLTHSKRSILFFSLSVSPFFSFFLLFCEVHKNLIHCFAMHEYMCLLVFVCRLFSLSFAFRTRCLGVFIINSSFSKVIFQIGNAKKNNGYMGWKIFSNRNINNNIMV